MSDEKSLEKHPVRYLIVIVVVIALIMVTVGIFIKACDHAREMRKVEKDIKAAVTGQKEAEK